MKQRKLLLAVIGAAVLLGSLAASAPARNYSLTNQRIRATWGRMDFASDFGTIECEITLEGSLHSRTIAKVGNTLVGYITAASVGSPCRRGGATALRETLPWHTTYRAFTGTLPNITSISYNVIGLAFLLREPTFGATCLARTTATEPAISTFNREVTSRALTSVTAGGTIRCRGGVEGEGTFSGTSSTLTNEVGGRITVTLI